MPTKRKTLRQIKAVLRLKFEAKLSHERIAAATDLSKGAVTSYLKRALEAGIGWLLEPQIDNAALEAWLFPVASASVAGHNRTRLCPPPPGAQAQGRNAAIALGGVPYRAAHPAGAYRYSQFCFHYGRFRDRLRRSMRQVHRAGEKLFLDYCGNTAPIIDAGSGELRAAQIFVAVLGASNYTYAEASFSQSLPDWIGSHIRTFEFLGSVRSRTGSGSTETRQVHRGRHLARRSQASARSLRTAAPTAPAHITFPPFAGAKQW